MNLPNNINESIEEFQKNDIENDLDYKMLLQQKQQLEKLKSDKLEVYNRLEQLYKDLQHSQNYNELLRFIEKNGTKLQDTLTLEGQQNRSQSKLLDVEIEWEKYGVNLAEYILEDEELLALYHSGLL
ncbi:hypothetical protein TBLA_0F04270 [Henningerozyma blattae CBS 6284]|uniref:Uncharacterized protein n=1 Tax=Henningerozyma blattae (strain ATCC 34711 / CBS 6284 / DSM 70876 / NBRC 10599 / NRRL Y-10934 / UCD 77-7) TaxID=1071380 RepID=I2H6F8_HENB6|nr:hypothetical protein TBLA_0F04270 [Tetrapisispora blattae CBS 6284]CCH61960.1 hypothetical protein TBLA_0F04270 [Tetrapisispora blattae CBS 6284]